MAVVWLTCAIAIAVLYWPETTSSGTLGVLPGHEHAPGGHRAGHHDPMAHKVHVGSVGAPASAAQDTFRAFLNRVFPAESADRVTFLLESPTSPSWFSVTVVDGGELVIRADGTWFCFCFGPCCHIPSSLCTYVRTYVSVCVCVGRDGM